MRESQKTTHLGFCMNPTPYEPFMFFTAGTYKIVVGRLFYIGSSTKIGSRVSEHRCNLERGEHWIKALQAEFDKCGTYSAFLLTEVPRKEDDTDRDHRQRLLMHEQWELTRWYGKKGCANVSADSGFNTGIGEFMKKKWQDPEFRARHKEAMAPHYARPVSEETREKMAAAKRGRGNPNARACTFLHNGEVLKFPCAQDAATHFRVNQQVIDQWLRGLTNFPGLSKKKPRKPWLAGLIGSYDKPELEQEYLLNELNRRVAGE